MRAACASSTRRYDPTLSNDEGMQWRTEVSQGSQPCRGLALPSRSRARRERDRRDPLRSLRRSRALRRMRSRRLRARCASVRRRRRPGTRRCFALVRSPVAGVAGREPSCRPPTASQRRLPARAGGRADAGQTRQRVRYEPQLGGAGQTVGIVDAFDDPKSKSDLGAFDAHYGLPECTTANGCFKKVGQTGSPRCPPPTQAAGLSRSRSMSRRSTRSARTARSCWSRPNSAADSNLATAANEAVALGATEVSNSYGGAGGRLGRAEAGAYNHPGVPIVAADRR